MHNHLQKGPNGFGQEDFKTKIKFFLFDCHCNQIILHGIKIFEQ